MRRAFAGLAGLLLAAGIGLAGAAGDPAASPASRLAVAGESRVDVRDFEWTDAARGRTVPVRVRTPRDGDAPLPVIIHSHGLGGSREGGAAWGEHWASHGYLVIHVQHPGSDEQLWQAKAGDAAGAMKALLAGANGRQLAARVQDVRFVLDEAARRKAAGDPAFRTADLTRVGMSGHSFGAQTTLALAGQRFGRIPGIAPFFEPRIGAALALSPNARGRGEDLDVRFGSIQVPFLSITGTRDGDVIGDGTTPASRTRPFEHMNPPGKYLAVFDGGDHRVFGGQRMRGTPSGGDARIQAGTKALTLAFWDAHLRGDRRAREWLESGGPRGILGPADRFETKPAKTL
jgi:predicted dienelactone hydrolase